MNILFLSCWYPSEENPLKGTFIREHARAIHTAGEKVIVLALNVKGGKEIYKKQVEKLVDVSGLETHLIHIESVFYKWIYVNPFWLYLILHSYFIREIRPGFDPDIIHSNILNPCAILGQWLASSYKKPHVITEHWSKVDKYMRINLLSGQGRKAYSEAKAVTCVSEYLRSRIENYIPDRSRLSVIPNVIDSKNFYFKPKISLSDKLVFSCIAQWTPPKRPMLFVEALELLSGRISKKIELHMIGEGPLLEQVKQFGWSYELIFHGNLSRQEVAFILHQSDFFLHASDVETFSMVCAEALSTGTPVIASKVGAIPELVNASSGILTDNSVDAWAEAIQAACAMNYDHAAISQSLINRCSSATVGSQFSRLYRSI